MLYFPRVKKQLLFRQIIENYVVSQNSSGKNSLKVHVFVVQVSIKLLKKGAENCIKKTFPLKRFRFGRLIYGVPPAISV